jgi:hypothetical protein
MSNREPAKSIPETTYKKLIAYFCTNAPDDVKQTLYSQIRADLEKKIQREVDHDLYTKFKTSPSEEERERARQQYLDRVGISKDHRW